MNQRDALALKERERRFREHDQPYGAHAAATRSRWSNFIEMHSVVSGLRLAGNSRLIDIGGADGRLLDRVRACNATCTLIGTDFAVNPLRGLMEKPLNAAGVCADMCALPMRDGSVSHAAAVQVLQQIPGRALREQALRSVHAALAPRGRFVALVLNQVTWRTAVPNGKEGRLNANLHVYLYDQHDLREELTAAGFSVRSIVGVNNLPGRIADRLGLLGAWIDMAITAWIRPLSIRKGRYLRAVCIKS